MGITTGGGVAFDEGASVRSAGQAFEQTAGRMQQENQFKRQQALLSADQSFGQLIKLGVASGNLEKFIAEHPQQFASVEQMMSAAVGRKITLAEGLQQGLGAVSGGLAENPSLGRMTYEYLQRLPGQAGGGTQDVITDPNVPKTAPVVPSPPGTVDNTTVPPASARATPTMDPAFQISGVAPNGETVRALTQGPIVSAEDARLGLGDSGQSALLAEMQKMGLAPPSEASTAASETTRAESAEQQRTKFPAAMDLKEGEVFKTPAGVKSAHTLAAMALKEIGLGSAEDIQAYVEALAQENPNLDINNLPPSLVLPKIEVQTADMTNVDARLGTGPRKVLRIIPRGGAPLQQDSKPAEPPRRLDGKRTSMVGAPVATFTQGTSSDVLSQAEQAGRAILDSRREQTTTPEAPVTRASTPSSLYISGTTRLPGGTPKPGAFTESQITKDAAAAISVMPKIVTPKATAALGKIELNTSASDTSETPLYDAKQAEISTAKFQDSFTKAVDLTKSLMSGDASKSLKQSDKAALAAAQTRAMALSEKIKGMDEGDYQKVRSEYVKWLESATPMELQAAGLPEVATKAESVWLARFQANAAIEAARARGGSETAAALIDMRGKAMDQVRGILEIANTAAKNDPHYKGDIAQFFQKNPMYRDMMVPFASMAFGQPVSIDMIMKDPTWFQKLMKQPGNVQGMGVSVNNWEGGRTTQATGTAPAVEKYYSKP